MDRVVIGIAGGTASGKSTVARGLVEALGARATLLEHDRYYRTVPPGTGLGQWNFDHPDSLETELLRAHVAAWTSGEDVQVPTYDFATQSRRPRAEWTPLHAGQVLVIEGILVLSDAALRGSMTHTVFVDAPDDIRLARRLTRDVAERGRGFHDILEQYFATVRPMHEAFVVPSRAHAELVLQGTEPVTDSVQRILTLIGVASGHATSA